MELKEFIAQTLIQITEGVKVAQEKVVESGAIVNPMTFRDSGKIFNQESENTFRSVQSLKMDIAITVVEKSGKKSGIGVVTSIIKAGISNDEEGSNSSTSRIQFEIPISLPTPDFKPKTSKGGKARY